MLKRLVIYVMCFVTLLGLSQPSDALSLSDAFNSLISETQPGVYSAQTRGYMTGGSYAVHFPTDSVQFISVSPPTVNAGCGGISIFLGGFSYINMSDFTALLQNIASSALGYAFQLSLRTLCPTCSTVLSDLQAAAQQANKLAMDECQFTEGLINQEINSNDQLQSAIQGSGAETTANSGSTLDFLQGFANLTSNVGSAFDDISNEINEIQNTTLRQQAEQSQPLGNSVWKMLGNLTDSQKDFVQSVLGTTIYGVNQDGSNNGSKNATVQPLPPTMTIDNLSSLFMYGALASSNRNLVVMQCGGTLIYNDCTPVTKVNILQSTWYHNQTASHGGTVSDAMMAQYGFFGMSYAMLFQALQNVEQNKPIGDPQQVSLPSEIYGSYASISSGFSETEIESFISLAPVPIYRAINLAAVYPDIAESLVQNISTIVATHYAVAFLQQTMTIKNSDNNQSSTLGLSPQQYHALLMSIQSLRSKLKQKTVDAMQSMTATTAWAAQVNQVQSLIYKQILQSGLSQNFAYSAGLLSMGGS